MEEVSGQGRDLLEKRSVTTRATLDTPTSLSIASQYSPCLKQLRAIYPTLSPAERRVADYVLADPSQVLRASVAAVAEASAVGIGTVARLSTKLGYGGFPDMKIALAVELLSPNTDTPEPVREDDDIATVIHKVLRFGAQSLLDTAALVDPVALHRAANAVTGARRVEVYAAGALSSGIAQVAQRRLLTLGIPCALYTQSPDHILAAGLLGREDAALGLSNSGGAPPVVDALRIASEAGARAICITSVPRSAVTKDAHIVLLSAFRESWFQGDAAASRIAMLGMIDALYATALLITHRQRTDGSAPESRCRSPS